LDDYFVKLLSLDQRQNFNDFPGKESEEGFLGQVERRFNTTNEFGLINLEILRSQTLSWVNFS